MPSYRLLTEVQRDTVLSLPDKISSPQLRKIYSFSEEELNLIYERRGDDNKLGMAIQIAFLKLPGRMLHPDEVVPDYLLRFLCNQLGLEETKFYQRDKTRKEHAVLIKKILLYKTFDNSLVNHIAKPLFETSLKVDDGLTLVQEALKIFRQQKIIIPGISTVEEIVWDTRNKSRQYIQDLMIKDLTEEQRIKLDNLLDLRDSFQTHFSWIRQPNGNPSPKNILKIIEKLNMIRDIDLPMELQQYIHQGQFLKLAKQGGIYAIQDLKKFDHKKRHALMIAFLLRYIEELTDQVFDMHDRQMISLLNRSKNQADQVFHSKKRSIQAKLRDFARLGEALIDAKESNKDAFESLEKLISWDEFIESVQEAKALSSSKKVDYLALTKNKYQRLRPYIKEILNSFDYSFSAVCNDLKSAVHILCELNQNNRRVLDNEAPNSFIKDRWSSLIYGKNETIDRRYYEICTMLELKDRLRAGDVSVIGSRKYKNFYDYWIAEKLWLRMWESNDFPVDLPKDFGIYLNHRQALLNEQFKKVARMLELDELPDVRLKGGQLNIAKLDKDIPDNIKSLTDRIYNLVPRVKITELLLEVEEMTGFTECFRHQMTGDIPSNKEALLSVLLAQATNMGYSNMADSLTNISARQLQNVEEKYINEDTLKQAQAELVNFQNQNKFSKNFGSGNTSSSDGQSFKLEKHEASWLNLNAKHGSDPVMTIYTHISDQYMPFYTQIIHNVRDATHVLDGLLYHDTNLEIEEHYTDTAGFTDHIFALCHLLGFRFAPRIKDLKEKNLYYIDKEVRKSNLNSLLGERLKVNLIRDNWEQIVRLVSSIKMGTVKASLMLKKLSAYPRQNSLAIALRELGRLERTIFILNWLQDSKLRRRVLIGLNKGELKHALADAICFYRQGIIQDRDYTDQLHRASSLNLVISAIVLWNTVHLEKAVKVIGRTEKIPEEVLNHLSPMRWQHISLSGDYVWKMRKQIRERNP